MLFRVALVRTDVSEKYIAFVIRLTIIDELGKTLALTSNWSTQDSAIRLQVTAKVVPSSSILVTLMTKAKRSSERLVLTRISPHNIPEDGILLQFMFHKFMPRRMYSYVTKQIPWPSVRKRTIPTERPPLVGEIWCQLLRIEGCRVGSAADILGR
jgi:hypothetical protein